MPNPYPFRDLRAAQKAAQAECALLLGWKHIEWSENDYAMFYVMSEMTHKTVNPTYSQMYGATGAWLRFLRRLVTALPEAYELRVKVQAEFDKLAEKYGDMLEDKNNVVLPS